MVSRAGPLTSVSVNVSPQSQIVEIRRHLFNLCVVMILNLLDEPSILREYKVDRSTFTAKATSSADPVDVVLLFDREFIVDHKTDLLHVNSTRKQVSGDKDTYCALTELFHNNITFYLIHFSVHNRDRKFMFLHSLLEFFHPFFSVTIDKCLVDVQVGV